MDQNYFFIDGSSLLAQIRKLWKKEPLFDQRRLDPLKFINDLATAFPDIGSAQYKRAVFYFPNGEPTLSSLLLMPDLSLPGLVRDVYFNYCGEKLDRSTVYEAWLDTVPPQWKDRCVKSEKGVDTEMCCDALKLASMGKMDRLFLFTNDRDFIPLCRTLKDLGVNVSLVHLTRHINPNSELLKECDSYDLFREERLNDIFEQIDSTQDQAMKIDSSIARDSSVQHA